MADGGPATRLRRALGRPVDPAGLAAFRVGFGLVATVAAVRFVARGWVDELLVQPTFHFTWVSGVEAPPAPVLYALFAVQAVAGLAIAAGRATRPALLAWLLAFGWVELIDKALYLNHYVLFTLLGLTLVATPAATARAGGPRLPAWCLWLLRVEVGSVYLWAGLAKLSPDWLLRAQPLRTWLAARGDLPLVGPLLAWEPTAWAMSWGGAAYDLLIPFLLLHPRTRVLGVGLVAFFHAVVGLVFPIGIFPILMVVAATLFLDPSWPRSWRPLPEPQERAARPVSIPGLATLSLVSAALLLLPGRHLLEPGHTGWHERGHRFAWRVLLMEKTGLVDFRAVERSTGRTWTHHPADELTELQHEQLRTQPDLLRDYALHLRDRHAAEGRDVAVYAEAWASLNGRPSQRLLRDDVDLTQPLTTLETEGWIVPLQDP